MPKTPTDFAPFQSRIERSAKKITGSTILWVDDNHPTQNLRERRALSALGISIDIVGSTADALRLFEIAAKYDAVISDMDRPPQADNATPCYGSTDVKGAGCGLLKALHGKLGTGMPPTIIYAGSFDPSLGTPPYAIGITNRVDHLLQFVLDALERRGENPT